MGALCVNMPEFLLVADLGPYRGVTTTASNPAELARVWYRLPIATRDFLMGCGIGVGEFEGRLYSAYCEALGRFPFLAVEADPSSDTPPWRQTKKESI